MISPTEQLVLAGLIHNEAYTRKVLPYVKADYFGTAVGRAAFSICSGYFAEYGECPTRAALLVRLEQHEGTSEDELRQIGETFELLLDSSEVGNVEFLTDTTEKWCQERAVYLALLESISIHDGQGEQDRGAIPQLLQEALAVSFDPHVGHDYLADYNERILL